MLAIVPLEGTAVDNGLPQQLTTLWNVVEGPGEVQIADSSKLKTTATFKVPGKYVIRLTADDGSNVRYDEVTITVQ